MRQSRAPNPAPPPPIPATQALLGPKLCRQCCCLLFIVGFIVGFSLLLPVFNTAGSWMQAVPVWVWACVSVLLLLLLFYCIIRAMSRECEKRHASKAARQANRGPRSSARVRPAGAGYQKV